jgi:hypothetical protein
LLGFFSGSAAVPAIALIVYWLAWHKMASFPLLPVLLLLLSTLLLLVSLLLLASHLLLSCSAFFPFLPFQLLLLLVPMLLWATFLFFFCKCWGWRPVVGILAVAGVPLLAEHVLLSDYTIKEHYCGTPCSGIGWWFPVRPKARGLAQHGGHGWAGE